MRLSDHVTDKELNLQLSYLIDITIKKTEFCLDWRNRRIAHKDLELVMKTAIKPLKPASRVKVKEALSSISDVLNAVSSHYMNSEFCFQDPGSQNGAVSLLYVLDDGLRADDKRREKLKAGMYCAEDYPDRDL